MCPFVIAVMPFADGTLVELFNFCFFVPQQPAAISSCRNKENVPLVCQMPQPSANTGTSFTAPQKAQGTAMRTRRRYDVTAMLFFCPFCRCLDGPRAQRMFHRRGITSKSADFKIPFILQSPDTT